MIVGAVDNYIARYLVSFWWRERRREKDKKTKIKTTNADHSALPKCST